MLRRPLTLSLSLFSLILLGMVSAQFLRERKAEAQGGGNQPAFSRINPTADMEYLGAFRLPNETSNGTSWSYGGSGMTYYPSGDPQGPADGYPGSLFGVGHPDQNYVSEFSIPAPVISPTKNLKDLPVAKTLQPFTDVTAGRMHDYVVLKDIQYYPKQGAQTADKLYWAMWDYYVPADKKLFGWSDLDLKNLQSKGAWSLGNFTPAATGRYLFDIPKEWADQYTPGKYLAGGRRRPGQSNGSWSPALYAFSPWNNGNPPIDGAALDAKELMYNGEGFGQPVDEGDGWGDEVQDGAWLSIGNKQAVIFAGNRALSNFQNGLEYYGSPLPGDTGSKGNHSNPHYKAIMFYDANDLALVVQGKMKSDEPKPYAVFNVAKYMFYPTRISYTHDDGSPLGGVGYDRANQLLYVMEQGVEGYYGQQPIIHVWRVHDNQGEFDTAPPSDPKNVLVNSKGTNYVEIAWNPATDNAGVSGYVVYRNLMFIAVTDKLTFRDIELRSNPLLSPDTSYTYSVAAVDLMNNDGPQSTPITVTTVSGTDTIPPNINRKDFQVSNVTPTSATISWSTDESTTATLEYNLLFDPNIMTISDPTLTKLHSLTLTGLIPSKRYVYTLSNTDAFGNSYRWVNSNAVLSTADLPPNNNQPPILDPIADQNVYAGEKIDLKITGSDPEGRAYFFSASDLPEGAMFNRSISFKKLQTAWFGWIPRHDQVGTHQVTFTITDGTVSTSKTVTITVTEPNRDNEPPVLAPIGDKVIVEATLLTFVAIATDPDLPANTLTFSLGTNAPAGANIDPDTGVFTWTPTASQGPADYNVTVRVTDNGQPARSDSEMITVTVIETSSYYVAANGSDNNDGSLGAPWATIAHAIKNTGPGDTVYLRGGTHVGNVELRGDYGNGGREGQWWTITSYPGEEAIINGSLSLYSTSYVRMSRLHFIDHYINLGRYTFGGLPRNHHIEVLENLITGIQPQYGAIIVIGDNLLVRKNTIVIDSGGGTQDHGIYLSEGDGNIVDSNYISGAAGFGIQLYVRTFNDPAPHIITNAVVKNNYVANTRGLAGYIASSGETSGIDGVIFENNISYHNAAGGLFLSYAGAYLRNIKVLNNTFAETSNGIQIGILYDETNNAKIQNIELKNNIIEATQGYHLFVGNGVNGLTESNNIYWPNPTRFYGVKIDASSIVADPLFVNVDNADLHLQNNSPAIDAGLAVPEVTTDYDNNPRPIDGNNDGNQDSDIGAHEYVPPPPPPTNQSPSVSAGVDQTITLQPNGAGASLDGTVSDDGLPNPPARVTTNPGWTKVLGPGTVTFGNANVVDTTASFSVAGTYTLRLTASDSILSSQDDVQIIVSSPSTPELCVATRPENRVRLSSQDFSGLPTTLMITDPQGLLVYSAVQTPTNREGEIRITDPTILAKITDATLYTLTAHPESHRRRKMTLLGSALKQAPCDVFPGSPFGFLDDGPITLQHLVRLLNHYRSQSDAMVNRAFLSQRFRLSDLVSVIKLSVSNVRHE